jgi:peptidoglycan hydrolase-like protein with peptidoglycan-binding domain
MGHEKTHRGRARGARGGLSTLPAASQADRATAIGRLDMAGLPDLDRNNIRSVQRALAAKGFEPGPADGIVGPLTRAVRS